MKKYDYSKKDIINALRSLNIKKNDTIFCHSNIVNFGLPKHGLGEEKLANIFFDSFFKILGKNGTLILPTFSYSFAKKEIYNPNKSRTICGFFPEAIRKIKKNFCLYPDPNLSCIIFGKNRQYLSRLHDKNSYGKYSLFSKFLHLNGKICNLNLDAGSTFLHFLERKLKIKYRFDKNFKGKINNNNDGVTLDRFTLFVLYKKIKKKVSFKRFTEYAKVKKLYKEYKVGRGKIGLIKSIDCYKILKKNIRKNKNFLFE
jgi:aminoglycoside 3-N-acetyltransferase